MHWLKSFFEENPGFASAMRYILITGFTWLMAYVTLAVFMKYTTFSEGSDYFIKIFLIITGGKLGHKYLENRNVSSPVNPANNG